MYLSLKSRGIIAVFVAVLLPQVVAADIPAIAPNFELPGQHQSIKLSDFSGKIVYLDFWASWCKPCLKSFPWMDSIQEKYQQDGLVVIAVNLDREQQQAKRFLAERSPKFQVAFDQQGETPRAYQLKGMPTSYLIDRNGRIISTHIGFNDSKKDHYENMIIQAIQSSTPDYSLKKEGKPQ